MILDINMDTKTERKCKTINKKEIYPKIDRVVNQVQNYGKNNCHFVVEGIKI